MAFGDQLGHRMAAFRPDETAGQRQNLGTTCGALTEVEQKRKMFFCEKRTKKNLVPS
jgi:hypothetical protein